MRESGLIVSSVVILSACSVAVAGPEVMDFESLTTAGVHYNFYGPTFIEGSYQLTNLSYSAPTAFQSAHTGNTSSYAGSTGFSTGRPDALIQLRRTDGGSFSLKSIDLSRAFNTNTGSIPVNFVGFYSGGGSVVLPTITITDPALGFVTYNFGPAWAGLSAVRWRQEPAYHQFDNISVTDNPVIPLPTGAVMAIVGMGVIGVRRRRG